MSAQFRQWLTVSQPLCRCDVGVIPRGETAPPSDGARVIAARVGTASESLDGDLVFVRECRSFALDPPLELVRSRQAKPIQEGPLI
jgi:hypothetical protein